MGNSARTTFGFALFIAVIGGLSGSLYIAIPLILIAAFLIVWGRAPTSTESFIGGLPWGATLLQTLRNIDSLTSQRQDRWEIDDLADRLDWAIHNLLNRNPLPKTTAEVAQWERDYQDWCDDISRKLGNRVFFTRADQMHFDTLGFVEPVTVTGNPELDRLLSQLRLRIERLRDVIRLAQQRYG
jgi:hypothetical protein